MNRTLAFVILLFASLDVAGWARGLPLPTLLIRVTWWLLSLAVVLQLVRQSGTEWLRWMARHQALLVWLLMLAALSSTWSLAPRESLHAALSLIATTLMGTFIGYALAPRAMAGVLSLTFTALVVANLAVLPLLPASIVVEPLTHQWRGLTDHKNSLGAIAAFAVVFHAAPLFRPAAGRVWRIALCAACVLALLLSRSVTSLLACGAGLAAMAWSLAGSRVTSAPRRVRVLLLTVTGIVVVAAAFSIAPITRALGRDATFNGRTPLWAASVQIIRERPFTGYGYHVVWGRRDASLLPHVPATAWRSALTAHNAVLSTATELGLPGAGLLIAYLIGIFLDAGRFHRRAPSAFSLFAIASWIVMATLSLAEAYLLAAHSVQWILCVATGVMLRRALDAGTESTQPAMAA